MPKPHNPPDFDPMPVVPGQGQFTPPDDEDLPPRPDIREASPDNPVEIAPGVHTTDPRLDRAPQFDVRSRNFGMAAVFEDAPKKYKARPYTWSVAAHLDQGPDGACVGFGWTHELIARPAVVDVDVSFARWLYKTAQKYDPWPGENYSGTSVLAGAKVLNKMPPAMAEGRGLIGEYRWIFGDLDDLVKTIGYFGPVVFGTNWYNGMFTPTKDLLLKPTGGVAGGHCYLVTGVDPKTKQLRVHNSWGEDWGEGGDAFLTFDDAIRLLNEDGECCVAARRRRLVE